MLVEDTTAFVERLEVVADDKWAEKRRRRLVRAELEMLEAMAEVRMASDAILELEQRLMRPDGRLVSPGRRLLHLLREPTLEWEIEAIRAHFGAKHAELEAKRERVSRLERQLREHAEHRQAAGIFRLHSATHHLHCSERQFARFSRAQRRRPVLVTKKDGRRWWWFLDRFWWDDTGLAAREVASLVLEADLLRSQQADDRDRALKTVFGPTGRSRQAELIPVAVRATVWARDYGRCVHCRSGYAVGFDLIVPIEDGGSVVAADVELRCGACHDRLARSERSTRIGQARVGSAPLRWP